jgi:2-succinyl-6-hydroxy-2,4-cyclohexadiene-1-carboxylate synthase
MVATRLAEAFYCVAPDLPGHGKTSFDPSRHGSFKAYAGSVVELLNTLDLAPVDAIGYSMGGRTLLYLVLSNPGLFDRVVLASMNPGLESDAARVERRKTDQALAAWLERESYDAFLATWYARPMFGCVREAAGYGDMIRRREKNDPHQLARALRSAGIAEQGSMWNGLASVMSNALVVCGENDIKYLDIAKRAVAQNDRFRYAVARGCGHAVHVEDPRGFADICRSFLKMEPGERNERWQQ